jgi:uncharacterized protein YyaL (SSP411 family)
MSNRLARESSPYLLQHADNPVDWYPWGEEAFARARAEDKPIFLSVGYSTCHWCHVMEHESFEDPAIAAELNAHFVPVKVDREERPDVDRVYMLFVQATTGAGGWPMSVWLTPDLEPFFGGTYFPPASRWGRPGFLDVLREIARLWREERPRLREAARALTGQLRAVSSDGGAGRAAASATGQPVVAGPEAIRLGAEQYRQAYDARHGGFGGAPKFPRPVELLFLFRAARATGDSSLAEMAVHTLQAMALGGMYDHVGGGFHRYAVDAGWRVPHFEKMLYDQAQLVLALVEAWQITGDETFRLVAGHTIDYVLRDLTHPDGGFYSAEDADSVPPEHAGDPAARKTEGAFYLWSAEEIDAIAGPDADLVKLRFGIEPGGNAPHDPHGEFGTKNLLYVARSIEAVAAAAGRAAGAVGGALSGALARMFEARRRRPRPHLDDKVLCGWNGLMIAALARAARVWEPDADASAAALGRRCREAAERAAAFLRRTLWRPDEGRLARRFRGGEVGIDAYAEDYACLAWGLLELFQATGRAPYLAWAVELQDTLDRLFWDPLEGAWYSTTGRDPSVLLRLKEDYDGAEPSASAVAVGNLLVLGHLMPERGWLAAAERTLARLGSRPGELARVVPLMLAHLAAWHAGIEQIVVVGPPDAPATRGLRQVVARPYRPFSVVVPVEPGPEQEALASLLPWLAPMGLREGRPAAYICRGFTCEAPETAPEALAGRLAS